jgi:hypothetical protein
MVAMHHAKRVLGTVRGRLGLSAPTDKPVDRPNPLGQNPG